MPSRSVCFAPELRDSVRAISKELVESNKPEACDLAVAADPDETTLAAARAALRPGGSLYTEWRSPAGGWRVVRGRLEQAGFEQIECYWPRPDPEQAPARVWLPFGASRAVRHYRAGFIWTANPLRWLRRAAGKLRWRLSPKWPICVAARRPAFCTDLDREGAERSSRRLPERGGDAVRHLSDRVAAGWTDWGFGRIPKKLSRVLLTGSLNNRGKVVALLFAPGDSHPRVALKSPRIPESAAALSREASALKALSERVGGSMPGAPRLLVWDPTTGSVAETAQDGKELPGLLRARPRTFRRLALLGTHWIADLAIRTRVDPGSQWRRRYLAPIVDDFEARFAIASEPADLRRARRMLESLEPLPLVFEQRDFSPWNVRVDRMGRLLVFDWESAVPFGFPALDLIYFLAYLCFYLENAMRDGAFRESYLEAFRRTLDPAERTGRVCRECVSFYFERLGIPGGALRPLRLLVWIIHARAAYGRIVEDLGRPPDAEQLRREPFLQLFHEELRSMRQP